MWPVFLAIYLSPDRYERYIQSPEWTFVWIATIVTAQSLVWLSTHWSVSLKTLFTTTAAKDVGSAKLIKVIPVANSGSAEICPLIQDKVRDAVQLSRVTTLTGFRITGSSVYPFSSRSAAFCIIHGRTPSHPCRTSSTRIPSL